MKHDKKNKTITMTEEELDVLIKTAVKAGKEENDKKNDDEKDKDSLKALGIIFILLLCFALYFLILIVFFPGV